MTEDINYCESESIYTESGHYAIAATSPCHKPCEDMAGMKDVDPKKIRQSALTIQKLREEHGLNKRQHTQNGLNPLRYLCTETDCVGPLIGKQRDKPEEPLDSRWRDRLKEKALRLPNRRIPQRSKQDETTQH